MLLHLMMGLKCVHLILALPPTGLWLVLDTNSQEMTWGVMVLKFYFGFE